MAAPKRAPDTLNYATTGNCAAFIRGEVEKWGKVIRDNNIRIEG
jgi:hypothetical protein